MYITSSRFRSIERCVAASRLISLEYSAANLVRRGINVVYLLGDVIRFLFEYRSRGDFQGRIKRLIAPRLSRFSFFLFIFLYFACLFLFFFLSSLLFEGGGEVERANTCRNSAARPAIIISRRTYRINTYGARSRGRFTSVTLFSYLCTKARQVGCNSYL